MTRQGAKLMVALIGAAACSTTAGEDRREGSSSAPTMQVGTDLSDGGSDKRAEEGAGSTWSDVYRDLFGPTAPASCAGAGMCHGSAEESGASASHGYVCATKDGCRASILSSETGLVQPGDAVSPERSTLVQVLRRRSTNGSIVGSMPKRSSFVFSDAAMNRITTWIRNGAPDD